MKRLLFISFFVWACVTLFAQSNFGKKIEFSQKGSLGYCDIETIKAIGLSGNWQNLIYRMQNRDYKMYGETPLKDGIKKQIWAKNVILDLETNTFDAIKGEVVSSVVIIGGSDSKISDMTVVYYNPGKDDVIYSLESGLKDAGFQLLEDKGKVKTFKTNNVTLVTYDEIDQGNRYSIIMRNYDLTEMNKQKISKNKAQDPILKSTQYLNGETPKVTCLTINELMDLFDGLTKERAEDFLSKKGYTFQWRNYSQYHWVKDCTIDQGFYYIKTFKDLSSASHVDFSIMNDGMYILLNMHLYNDKICAYLVNNIEKLGYKIRHKGSQQPENGVDVLFEKEIGGVAFRVISQKPLRQAKVPEGTIQYMIQLMSPDNITRLKNIHAIKAIGE